MFIDFWNLMLNVQKQTSTAFVIDLKWGEIVQFIVRETSPGYSDETTGEMAGCYIFGSYSRSNGQEAKRIDSILDGYGSKSGIFCDFSERISKNTNIRCDKCGNSVSKSSEWS